MKHEDQISPDVADLIARCIDNELSPEELDLLATHIAQDPAVAAYYSEEVFLHTELYLTAAAACAYQHNRDAIRRRQDAAPMQIPARPASPWRHVGWILAAAAAFALAFVALQARRDPSIVTERIKPPNLRPAPVVATLADGVAMRLAAPTGGLLRAGSDLTTGSYDLHRGLAEIHFLDGTVAILEGPARFSLKDKHVVHLDHGRIHLRMRRGTSGFKVVSDRLEVTDLGTAFGVYAADDDYAEVHVFDGSVLVRTTDDDGIGRDTLRLEAGAAVRVFRRSAAISGTDLSPDSFVRTLHSPESVYAELIQSMKPLMYYPMNLEGGDVGLHDAAGGAHGEIRMSATTASPWSAGKFGHALRFADPLENAYVTVPDFPRPEGDVLSVVAWVNAESRPNWAQIAANWAQPQNGLFHFGLYGRSGQLCIEVTASSHLEKHIYVTDPKPIPLGSWQHVAFVADGNVVRLYRNGNVVASAEYGDFVAVDPTLTAMGIGAKLTADGSAPMGNFWHGRIDELAVFGHALSDDQIRRLYQAGNTPQP